MLQHAEQRQAEVTGLMHHQRQLQGAGTRILPRRCSVKVRKPLPDLRNFAQLHPRFASVTLQSARCLCTEPVRAPTTGAHPRLTRSVRREDQGTGSRCAPVRASQVGKGALPEEVLSPSSSLIHLQGGFVSAWRHQLALTRRLHPMPGAARDRLQRQLCGLVEGFIVAAPRGKVQGEISCEQICHCFSWFCGVFCFVLAGEGGVCIWFFGFGGFFVIFIAFWVCCFHCI